MRAREVLHRFDLPVLRLRAQQFAEMFLARCDICAIVGIDVDTRSVSERVIRSRCHPQRNFLGKLSDRH